MRDSRVGIKVREKTKGSGIYWVFVCWFPPGGKKGDSLRTSMRVGSEQAARAVAVEIDKMLSIATSRGISNPDVRSVLREAATHYQVERDMLTLGQFAPRWIEMSSAYGWKKSTLQNYESMLAEPARSP